MLWASSVKARQANTTQLVGGETAVYVELAAPDTEHDPEHAKPKDYGVIVYAGFLASGNAPNSLIPA